MVFLLKEPVMTHVSKASFLFVPRALLQLMFTDWKQHSGKASCLCQHTFSLHSLYLFGPMQAPAPLVMCL